jgi:hypothetical protein
MRRVYSTITPAVVRSEAQTALQQSLTIQPYGRSVQEAALLGLLLLVAATGSSLSACVRRFRFGFSHETARQALQANLPEQTPALTEELTDSLHAVLAFSRQDRKRRWDVAIDTHYCPYYGHTPKTTTPGVGGQKKQGTNYFFAYATAVLIHRRRRYTVGLVPLPGKVKPQQIVAALVAQISARGRKIRGVVLDSGFDSGDTILLLQQKRLAYTIPLRRKGKGNNKRNACFALPVGTVSHLAWTTDQSRRKVKTPIVVMHRHDQPEIKVDAFRGWFGIETSYRQKNQAKGTTTARSVAYRLLLEGLALLWRQVWVRLTEILARARRAKPTDWMGELPLERMLDWLADLLKTEYKEYKSIPLLPLLDPSF